MFLHQKHCQIFERLTVSTAGKDIRKWELSDSASGNINLDANFREPSGNVL